MKKICFVNPQYIKNNIGGAEVQMYLLAKEFIKSGWQVFYVSEDISEKTIDEGIQLIPFKGNKNYATFEKVLKEIDADVYYQRGRKKHTCFVSKFTKRHNKLFVFANSMEIDAKKYKFITRLNWKNPLSCIARFIPFLIMDLSTLYGMKNAKILLSQTKEQQNAFSKNLSLDSVLVKKIYPSPSVDEIRKKKKPIVLWTANIKKWKQPELFLKLVDKLHRENCSFIMVGGLVDKSYSTLISQYEKQYANFKYLGKIEYSESEKLFHSASIFVNTSKNYESQPNTYIQSWLNQVPVVALNHDSDGVIEGEKIGYHSKTFEQLVKDIKRLINDESLRNEMGMRGREYAIKMFSNKQFEKLKCLIEDQLAAKEANK